MKTDEEIIDWFFEHYTDPANCLPYESKEGGYIPIYGQLEETADILYSNFPELNDNDVERLVELIEWGEFEHGSDIWSPVPGPEWYGEHFDEVVISSSESVLLDTIRAFERLRELLQYNIYFIEEEYTLLQFAQEIVNDDITLKEYVAEERSMRFEQEMLHLLFIKTFAVMESFLEDFIINYAKENITTILNDINRFKKLRDQKLNVGQLIRGIDNNPAEYQEQIRNEIQKCMWAYYQSILWHNFSDAKKEYERFKLKIDLPKFHAAIPVRHDLIHRDGKKKEDMQSRHEISRQTLRDLVDEGLAVVNKLFEQTQPSLEHTQEPSHRSDH